MKITHGLMSGQVLQRDPQGKGAATLTGRAKADGELELRVLKSGKAVRGHDWRAAGRIEGPSFDATLTGLRTGGPYRVELRVKSGRKVIDQIALDEIFVGDVWILAGQSNMEGVGNLAHAPKPHPQVRAFFMRDEWGMAEEKLHYLCEAVDVVHNSYGDEPGRPPKAELEKGRANLVKGTSPGLAFALDMLRRTRIPQGLIPCAHGGTSMDQWSPALRGKGGASLYGAMMRRYEKLGQPLAGILWYQGESDANQDAYAQYTDKMVDLVAATRRDMGLPRLPWLIVQLGCHAAREHEFAWNSIQEQQRLLPQRIKDLDVAPAIDLELDDGIHIGGESQRVLGRRLARIADRMVHKARGVKAGIVFRGMKLIRTPHITADSPCMSVELSYGNVSGRLMANGRAAGFTLLNERGEDVCGIYKTSVHGNRVVLHTNMGRHMLELLSVSYGHGRYPICTITDREGMSIPGMQAVPICPDHAIDCTDWKTARISGATSISQASYARTSKARGWKTAPRRAGFGVLPKAASSDQVAVYALRTTLRADVVLEAELLFGANAPFKIWLNGKRVLADKAASAPLNAGQYSVSMSLKHGKNELLVAFAPRGAGALIGISARVGTPDGRADPRITIS